MQVLCTLCILAASPRSDTRKIVGWKASEPFLALASLFLPSRIFNFSPASTLLLFFSPSFHIPFNYLTETFSLSAVIVAEQNSNVSKLLS